jgi:hypothetical protein
MRTTEKKYWVNGHQIRGGHFHTFATATKKHGFLLSFSILKPYFNFEIMKFREFDRKPLTNFRYEKETDIIQMD